MAAILMVEGVNFLTSGLRLEHKRHYPPFKNNLTQYIRNFTTFNDETLLKWMYTSSSDGRTFPITFSTASRLPWMVRTLRKSNKETKVDISQLTTGR